MPDDPGLNSIGQIHISVDDMSAAVEFYRDVVGLTLLFEVPGQPMAFFDCGGVRLYLGEPEDPAFRSSPLIYYRVADIHGSTRALEGRGVDFDSPPHLVHRTETSELWMAGFRDPAGNHLMLMSEIPVAS